jgi:outer membrane lipoprotein carrier protein
LAHQACAQAPTDVPSLIRKFESVYRSARTLRATFIEKYFEGDKLVRSEAGIAYFSKGGKMRWEYRSPEPNLYVVDGKWSWFYVPADHTATRMAVKESSDTRTPFALLAGEVKVRRLCSEVRKQPLVNPIRSGDVVLLCRFRGGDDRGDSASRVSGHNTERDEVRYALFELVETSGELVRVVIRDPGGVWVEFQFADWEFNPRIDDSPYHFQAPKGVAIVDGDLSLSRVAGGLNGDNR